MNCINGWHVLYVKSRWEKKVYESLKENSVEAFLPQTKTVRQWSDRKKTIVKPLFPSYVFVNITSSLEFYKALSVDGACAYIKFGKEYARVSEKEINQVKFLVEEQDVSDVKINSEILKVGEIKKILFGPLSGFECQVVKAGNINKIIVEINSLRQNITASIPSFYFEEPSMLQRV